MVIGDICDIELLNSTILENEIDLIINLAGLAGVRPLIEDPLEYEDVNIKGFLNILEAARKNGIKK